MTDFFNNSNDDLLVAIERFELVAKATHDVIWDWDLVKSTVWWSPGIEHIFGHSIAELDKGPASWYDHIHPDDQERVIESIHKVIDFGGQNWSDVYRFRRADGTYADVHDRGYTIQSDGKPVRMVGSMMDVTEQIRLEKARLESEQNLKFAMEAAELGTWNFDPATKKIVANKRGRELYGNPDEDESGYVDVSKYVHPDDKPRVKAAIADAMNPALRAPYDIRYRTIGAKDQVLRWLHCKGQAYFTAEGIPYRFAGISREITEEVLNVDKVLWADKQAAMTIEGSGAGSFHVNVGSDEIIYSPTMAKIITGHEDKRVTRISFIEHIHKEDLPIRKAAYAQADKTGELRYEVRFIWDDGSVHWVRVIGQYLFDRAGNATSLSGIVMDITDRIISEQLMREGEEKYRQLASELERRVQQRTAELNEANLELINSNNSLQQFAYAASHDMQEPLRKIQSFGSRLHAMYAQELDANGVFMLNRIQDASKRMSAMIDDLLAYSRLSTQEAEFQSVDLNLLVNNVIADLEIAISEQETKMVVDQLPEVYGIFPQLAQLMQNLISNAIKYRKADELSVVTIKCHNPGEDELFAIPKRMEDHDYVRIDIQDNGIGFNEVYLDKIFQMFQRLHGRSAFSGSGIGLALCKKVVQNHQGHITAKSTEGEGSTFMVYLPLPK